MRVHIELFIAHALHGVINKCGVYTKCSFNSLLVKRPSY